MDNAAPHLVGSPFVLCYALGAFAALGGGELGHPDLAVPRAHGQGAVPAVRQELGLKGGPQGGTRQIWSL